MNQTYFQLLVISSALGLCVWLIANYKAKLKLKRALEIKKIREEEQDKVRRRMARDFHDNMGNQLASITVFTSLINGKLINSDADIKKYLEGIEFHARSLFNGTKDFIWSMDPTSDNIETIYTYLMDFGEELFEGTPIQFYSKWDTDSAEKLDIAMGINRQIVLILKESFTNTLKHSNANKCHFNLNIENDNYVFTFSDNGIGLDPSHKSGNGLRNMKARASEIDTELLLSNLKSGGTKLRLKGKIKNR